MHTGKLVFAQIMLHLPLTAFGRMVARHRAQHKVKEFTCLDQFLALAFAQLTGRESLRDIEINLRAQSKHLYHLGFRCKTISRNTLANANRVRPWQVFADLAQHLIGIARPLYAQDPSVPELKALMGATVYALDSSTIDLCLSLFAWAPFRSTKAAIKLHTLIDLRGSIPSFIHISDGKMHDVRVLDLLCKQGFIEAGSFYVMDKAYVDSETDKFLTFLTNNLTLPALTICALYKQRWQVELFFKWIKQHLRIKSFLGTSENAVKTQIWIAIATYVLIAIVKKRLNLSHTLYEILRVLDLSMFETTPIADLLDTPPESDDSSQSSTQFSLFTTLGH